MLQIILLVDFIFKIIKLWIFFTQLISNLFPFFFNKVSTTTYTRINWDILYYFIVYDNIHFDIFKLNTWISYCIKIFAFWLQEWYDMYVVFELSWTWFWSCGVKTSIFYQWIVIKINKNITRLWNYIFDMFNNLIYWVLEIGLLI